MEEAVGGLEGNGKVLSALAAPLLKVLMLEAITTTKNRNALLENNNM